MQSGILNVFLTLFGWYLGLGLLFALPFVVVGAGKLDPHARTGSWGFRALILPGSILLWPLLGKRWIQGRRMPPEERSAHRRAATPEIKP